MEIRPNTSHWGELSPKDCQVSHHQTVEREQSRNPRSFEIVGPRLHQPSKRHFPQTDELHPAELFEIDNITAHTIKLIKYTHALRSLINNAHLQLDNAQQNSKDNSLAPSFNFPDAPKFPERPFKLPTQLDSQFPFRVRYTESNFSRGIGPKPPVINENFCYKLMKKSVAAICAHAGFDTSSEIVLDTLTESCQEYTKQLCNRLRSSSDNTAQHGISSFSDIMEQVFHEIGIGPLSTIQQFYQKRVLDYHSHINSIAQKLTDEYAKIKSFDKCIDGSVDDSPSVASFSNADEDQSGDVHQIIQFDDSGLETDNLSHNFERGKKSIQNENKDGSDFIDSANISSTPIHSGNDLSDCMQSSLSTPEIQSPPSMGSLVKSPNKKFKR